MTMPAFTPQIQLYQEWLQRSRGLTFDSYDALWHWSTTEIEAFWQIIWEYCDLQSPTPYKLSGGTDFAGAFWAATANCRKPQDACNAACWGRPCMLGMKLASR